MSEECEVFRLSTQSCDKIDSLNAPSANSCAVTFNNNHIIKFGGVLNKVDGNNLMEMYTILLILGIMSKIIDGLLLMLTILGVLTEFNFYLLVLLFKSIKNKY